MEENNKNITIICSIGFALIVIIISIFAILGKEKETQKITNPQQEITDTQEQTISETQKRYTSEMSTFSHKGTKINTTSSRLQTERSNELLNKGYTEISEKNNYSNRQFQKDNTTIFLNNYGHVVYVSKIINNRSDLKKYNSRNELDLINEYYKMPSYEDYVPVVNALLNYAAKDNDINKINIFFKTTELYITIDEKEVTYRFTSNGYDYGYIRDIELYQLSVEFNSDNHPYTKDLVKLILDMFMAKNKDLILDNDYITNKINEFDKYNSLNIHSKHHFSTVFSSSAYRCTITYGKSEYENIKNAIYYNLSQSKFTNEYNSYLTSDFTYFNNKKKYNLKLSNYDKQIKEFLNSGKKKITIELNDELTLEIEDTTYDKTKPVYTIKYIENN